MDANVTSLLAAINAQNAADTDTGLAGLSRVLLAKVGSYLPAKDVLCKLPLVCRRIAVSIRREDAFWKALNSEMNEHHMAGKALIDLAYQAKDFERIKELRKVISRIENFILDQQLLNSMKFESPPSPGGELALAPPSDLYRVFKVLKINYDVSQGQAVELMPLDASSTDYNQSVHRSVNRDDPDQFWSSAGSPSSDANEWLKYKVPIHNFQEIQM